MREINKSKVLLPFPNKKYDIIYADPPWLYKCGKNHLSKKSIINGNSNQHYNAMSMQELMALPVNEISNDNCLLFMWVTAPFLEKGIELAKVWGFTFSTISFVWNKNKINPGSYTLSEVEICLVAKKGKIPTPRGSRKERQYLSETKTIHSRKPTEIRNRIFRMFPIQTKIELFAREKTEGWDVWGNEV